MGYLHFRWHEKWRRYRLSTSLLAARHLGLDPELRGFWSHWIIEDLQELTEGWWENSLYSGWVSTKEFEDTGEQTGFMASTIPETGNQEDDVSSWDLSDDEDEDATERENILKNAVLGMTQSARYLWLHLWQHQKRIVRCVLLCQRNDGDLTRKFISQH